MMMMMMIMLITLKNNKNSNNNYFISIKHISIPGDTQGVDKVLLLLRL